ncbi:MAG: radical SAM protein, partial [Ruminiclostridium sp.]|nr:radical SAM protein [Ruminiclostridium sp.]
RECGIDRAVTAGYCGCTDEILVAKYMLHYGEEPCISGTHGSGAVFFSGCNLRCPFCQNYPISHEMKGRITSPERLRDIFFELKDKGAHNINLVTATQYADVIAGILRECKKELNIPVVYNCGGYESIETLTILDGLVDIYLPDMKYYSKEMSAKYSGAPDYFVKALNALKEMLRQQPEAVTDEDGIMRRGVIMRHLVLPNGYHDSMKVLDEIGKLPVRPLVSIMRQYTPCYDAVKYPEINRKLTTFEYEKVTEHCADLGLNGFMQKKGCDNLDMTPDFS